MFNNLTYTIMKKLKKQTSLLDSKNQLISENANMFACMLRNFISLRDLPFHVEINEYLDAIIVILDTSDIKRFTEFLLYPDSFEVDNHLSSTRFCFKLENENNLPF